MSAEAIAAQDGAAKLTPSADDYTEVEMVCSGGCNEKVLRDIARLEKGKDVLKGSRLITLSPEFDHSTRLVRIGGRLPQFQTIGVHIFGRR